MEIGELFTSYIRVLALAALVIYGYAWTVRIIVRRSSRSVMVGLLFGLGGVLSMNDPLVVGPGLIYDARSILLVLSPIYAGPVGTVIAAMMMGIYRLSLGGIGATGVASVFLVPLIGYACTLIRRYRMRAGLGRSLLLGFATVSSFIGVAFLPWDIAEGIFLNSVAPIMLANILGVLLLADLLEREKQRIQIVRALENEASVDPLTKLPNRRVFQRAADRCAEAASSQGRPFSIIMLDIDHFKKINDTWGHHVGDTVLSKVADLIRQAVRKTDIAARYGGEEIVVLLPDTTEGDASTVAEKIRHAIEAEDLMVDNVSIRITVSIGVSGGSSEIVATMEAADRALYRAKTSGRNCVELANAA
ncbi:diguanylate cyclase [Rhizobium sp. P32RR-XVIII]|uniref:GGDEF domain-containing protein n=1 Tax=Rhizobium sp. P32RR-XVIII TaxID=2726738 RepID=UPI00145782CF|nr:diguanylate cyclase [Rhizobium sp. P32RR-XVIII]NLS07772.1 diguanylate cyclase [Rhizobium sp. P32RR-XVIII]